MFHGKVGVLKYQIAAAGIFVCFLAALIYLYGGSKIRINGLSLYKATSATAYAPGITSEDCLYQTDFPGTVILGRPTNADITFNILSTEDIPQIRVHAMSTVTGAVALSPVFPVEAGLSVIAKLSGLMPSSGYYYTIVRGYYDGTVHCSPMHTFQTQRAPGEPFKFSVVADSHLGTENHCDVTRYAQTLTNVHNDNPDFVISLGDDFRASMLKQPAISTDVEQLYLNQRPYANIVAQDAALFNVNGNHELQFGWLLDGSEYNVAVWALKSRLAHFPNPRPNSFYSGQSTPYNLIPNGLLENYYAWIWGNSLFIVLDDYFYSQSESGWDVSLGSEQYFWLGSVVQTPATFKFVFHHHLCGSVRGGIEWTEAYEWGGYTPKSETNSNQNWAFTEMRPGWPIPIHPMLVASGVTIVFQGHDHLYTKQDHPDGIVYMTVPMPGFNPVKFFGGDNDNSESFHSGTILSPAGHLTVEITANTATVNYIYSRIPADGTKTGVNGQLANSFTITK